eukprot:m.554714 g.554714  ORF g.554714 m.554714 type:complete len:464 (+) comp22178_c0_seq11:74-1465(+)
MTVQSAIQASFVTFCVATTLQVAIARDGSIGSLPAMGWNTWCTESPCGQNGIKPHNDKLHDVCHEDEVKEIASSMMENGMQAAGYTYINLDDCWIHPNRTVDGKLQPDPNRFPSGMAAMADWLHDRGFKFGVYTSGGFATCSNGGNDPAHSPGIDRQNASIPGDWNHYQQDASTIAAWGVDFLKMDWCVSTDPHNPRFKLDIENITMHMHHCLNTTGRQLWFNFHCPNSGGTSPDTVPEWCPAAGNSYRVGPDHHDYWPNTAHAIDILKHGAMWSATGPNTNTTGWNDPDFLMTGGAGCDRSVQGGGLRCPGQTDVEYKTEFSLWTMAAAQLLVATDVRQITPFMREVLLNLELIAVNQDPLGVAGGLVEECNGDATKQVWGRPLHDGSLAIALYNSGEQNATITSNFTMLPKTSTGMQWTATTLATVRDLWAHEDLTTVAQGSFSAVVAAHETKVFKLVKAP